MGSESPASVRLTRRGRAVVLLSVVVFFFGGLALGGFLYLRSIGAIGSHEPGAPVSIVIPKGSSANDIGELLEEEGIVPSAFGFRIAMNMNADGKTIEAGRYELFEDMTAPDAIDILLKGAASDEFVTVTFPEGFWLEDFARRLEKDTHLSGDRFMKLMESGKFRSKYQPEDIDTLEGLLFPSTYQVIERDTEESVLRRLIGEFDKQMDKLDFSQADAMGVTPYEVAIIASMVEAEAAVDADRTKIARVIYNRLDEGMSLGIDATVIYALGEHTDSLTESDLEIDSPYNTRQVAGLPPTPIGASGAESLAAAAAPEEGDWLYYVLADCDGNHAFSVSYDEFLQNKAAYQQLEC
jgi:UPF0755 protein